MSQTHIIGKIEYKNLRIQFRADCYLRNIFQHLFNHFAIKNSSVGAALLGGGVENGGRRDYFLMELKMFKLKM